jgi:bacterioferritin
MKGEKTVIQQLNKVLTYELTSINQFFLHARMFGNWGFEALNEKAYKKSIKDMKQADKLIERVLLLEGLPNLQHLDRLRIGETPEEMLIADQGFVSDQLTLLKTAIQVCETEQDYVSRELLEDILEYEEDYLDWLETQQQLISSIGIENYLQSMT